MVYKFTRQALVVGPNQLRYLEIVFVNFRQDRRDDYIQHTLEKISSIEFNGYPIQVTKFVSFSKDNSLHFFIASKRTDPAGQRYNNLSMRKTSLEIRFTTFSFTQLPDFTVEFFTYNQLDFKIALIEQLISNDIDKQSLFVRTSISDSDFGFLSPLETIQLLAAHSPKIVLNIFPESSLVIHGILLLIAAGHFGEIGDEIYYIEIGDELNYINKELKNSARQYLAEFFNFSFVPSQPSPSPAEFSIPTQTILKRSFTSLEIPISVEEAKTKFTETIVPTYFSLNQTEAVFNASTTGSARSQEKPKIEVLAEKSPKERISSAKKSIRDRFSDFKARTRELILNNIPENQKNNFEILYNDLNLSTRERRSRQNLLLAEFILILENRNITNENLETTIQEKLEKNFTLDISLYNSLLKSNFNINNSSGDSSDASTEEPYDT